MPDTLARRAGVELIRTGRWDISTGQWTATRDDLAAAVAALSCPAIQKPIVKIGHTDKRFTPGDGEPAIGWYENLRTTDGGHTLVADQVAPAWLTDVQAAAWPNRSVEGSYNFRCGLGHTHPFVLTAVALLGVTPPGVSTLTSLNSLADVRALYGLAASSRQAGVGEVRIAASVPGTALQAAAEVHTGAMVALIPTTADAERLAVDGGEPADQLHVTLMYLGQAAELPTKARAAIVDAVRRATDGVPVVEGNGFSVAAFNPPGAEQADGKDRDTCLVLGVGGDDLADTRDLVSRVVHEVARRFVLDLSEQHRPWVPHITLTYSDDLDQVKALADRAGPVTFDRIRVAFAGEHIDIPLTAFDSGPMSDDEPARDVEPPLQVPNMLMPVAAAGDAELRAYWLSGEGAAKIRWNTPGDFTRCVRHLRKHVSDPKGLCAEYHHEATGMWPGDRRNVTASEESAVPNPQEPTLTERIHRAWNASGQPEQQWIVEAAEDEVIVMDNTDRSLVRVPVTVDGDSIQFGEPQRVRPAYVPADEPVAAARMVFASVEESRPDVAAHATHNQKTHGNRSSGARKSGGNGDGRSDARRHVDANKKLASDLADVKSRFGRKAEDDEFAKIRRQKGLPSNAEIGQLTNDSDRANRDAGQAARVALREVRELAELRVRLESLTAQEKVYRSRKGDADLQDDDGIDRALERIAQEKAETERFIKGIDESVNRTVRELKQRKVFAAADDGPADPDDRNDPADPQTDPAGDAPPSGDDPNTSGEPSGTPPPVPPAAEPESNTDPKEDPVSTLSTDVRSRLGLSDDADDATVLAALADLKTKADAAPNPKDVAAARDEMKTEITRLSTELAEIRASAAADTKKALFDGAVREGRIKPADREKWELRYDRAPEVTTEILASLAPNTEVPVAAAGYTGQVDMGGLDDEYEQLVAGIDGPAAAKGGN